MVLVGDNETPPYYIYIEEKLEDAGDLRRAKSIAIIRADRRI
jgi:hypothetical protein